jgi:hypothetical protein
MGKPVLLALYRVVIPYSINPLGEITMISKQSIISIALGTVLAFTLGTAAIALANNPSTAAQFEHKGIIVAEAHQHGQEKGSAQGSGGKHGEGQQGEGNRHRHGQDKDRKSGHGDHQEGKDKDGHDKGKGKSDQHGDKESSGMMKGGHDYAHMIIPHADALKLSDEQLGKITRQHLKHKKEHEKLKQKLHKSMKEFHSKSMQPSASDAQVLNLSKELTAAFNEMIEYHIKERQAVQAILSDEQKNQLNTLKLKHEDHDGDKHEGHGGHGGHGKDDKQGGHSDH